MWANWTKTRLNIVIYMRQTLKNSFQPTLPQKKLLHTENLFTFTIRSAWRNSTSGKKKP